MSDIKKFAVQETGVLKLLSADQKPLMGDDGQAMTITMYGPGSKQYAKAQASNANRVLDQMKRGGKLDQSAEEKAIFLASVTKEFSPNIEYDGLAGEDLFKAVYGDPSIGFIAEQAAKFDGEWANFMKASPES